MSVPPVLNPGRRSFRWLWFVVIGALLIAGLIVYSSANFAKKAARMARTAAIDEEGRSIVLTEMQWDHGTLIADTFFQELPTTHGDLVVTSAYIDNPVHFDDASYYKSDRVNVLVHPTGRTSEYRLRFPAYKGKGGESLRLMLDWKPVDNKGDFGSSGCDIQIPPKPTGG